MTPTDSPQASVHKAKTNRIQHQGLVWREKIKIPRYKSGTWGTRHPAVFMPASQALVGWFPWLLPPL